MRAARYLRCHGLQLAEALAQQLDIAEDLAERESRHHVNFVRRPNPGFTMAAWSWAKGNPLHTVLRDSELAPGDLSAGAVS